MFGRNQKRVDSLNLASLVEKKSLSERALDFYWNTQIEKAQELDKLDISEEKKLKKLSWNSWPTLFKSTLIYLSDLPVNFYRKEIYQREVLYLSPLASMRLSWIEKIYNQNREN